MTREAGIDVVEFVCPECSTRWTRDYPVVHIDLPSGERRDYYVSNDKPVMPPFSMVGAVPCPRCGRHTTGRLAGTRSAPAQTTGG